MPDISPARILMVGTHSFEEAKLTEPRDNFAERALEQALQRPAEGPFEGGTRPIGEI